MDTDDGGHDVADDLPLLEIFRRLTARRPDRFQLLTLVIAGYLAVWLGFGIAAHGADWLLHEIVERSSWLEANAWLIGAATLLLAGGFQFSRLKYRCLDKCRAPLSFVTEYWRGRARAAQRIFAGYPSRPILRRLLLGIDALDVRRRRWQCRLDVGARSSDGRGEKPAMGPQTERAVWAPH